MLVFKTISRRSLLCAVFIVMLVMFLAGCEEEPIEPRSTATQTPLPTLASQPIAAEATPTLNSAALPTPAITPSPSGPTATPSATPSPGERLDIGDRALQIGDYELAVEQYSEALQQAPSLEINEQADTLLKLGQAYLAEEKFLDSATIFNQLIDLQGAGKHPNEAFFWLGQAYAGQNEYEAAIKSYELFLNQEPEMGGYIYRLIAEAYSALGDDVSAVCRLRGGPGRRRSIN